MALVHTNDKLGAALKRARADHLRDETAGFARTLRSSDVWIRHVHLEGVDRAVDVDVQRGRALVRDGVTGALLGWFVVVVDEPAGGAVASEFKDNALEAVVLAHADVRDNELGRSLGAFGFALHVGLSERGDAGGRGGLVDIAGQGGGKGRGGCGRILGNARARGQGNRAEGERGEHRRE